MRDDLVGKRCHCHRVTRERRRSPMTITWLVATARLEIASAVARRPVWIGAKWGPTCTNKCSLVSCFDANCAAFYSRTSVPRCLNCRCQTVVLHRIEKLLLLFCKSIHKRLDSIKPFIAGVKSKYFFLTAQKHIPVLPREGRKKAEVETVHTLICQMKV